MKTNRLLYAVGPLVLVVFALFGAAQDQTVQPPGTDAQARGPVHEAYAEPISDHTEQGAVVAKQPPAPIDELPPEEKPEGDNVQWIPGYWAFDQDQGDFLWVSGFWRVPPPGRRWVPGHWQEVENGWIWNSGFWAPDNLQQLQYMPAPPPSVETGPPVPAPDAASIYVAGCWVYQGRYLWRPGHWIAYRPGWVWIPAHYIWTPVGCLFVEGYWDHPLDERGVLFAPVRFDLGVWLAARRPYVPEFVIHTDFLLGALFVGPHQRHYWFGDYFEERYAKRGFVAWDEFRPSKGMVDPNFAYYRQVHRGEAGWEASLHELYSGRRSGAIPRPPHTLAQQQQIIKNITVNKTLTTVVHKNVNLTHLQNVTALAPLKAVPNYKATHLAALTPGKESKVEPRAVKLVAVPQAEHLREQKAAVQMREFGQERRASEATMLHQGATPIKHTDAPKVVKMPLPTPPAPVTKPPPVVRTAPPLPQLPQHVEHAVPKYEPRPPPAPPKKDKK
jgi:hypothetical protein